MSGIGRPFAQEIQDGDGDFLGGVVPEQAPGAIHDQPGPERRVALTVERPVLEAVVHRPSSISHQVIASDKV